MLFYTEGGMGLDMIIPPCMDRLVVTLSITYALQCNRQSLLNAISFFEYVTCMDKLAHVGILYLYELILVEILYYRRTARFLEYCIYLSP